MSGGFVLLCYPRNAPYSYDAHTPLSVLALGTYLETRGVEVEYFDERIDPPSRFDELLQRGPRLAGFSVIGGHQIVAAARLSRRARRLAPGVPLVWGGILPTTLPEETAREPFVDYAVRGEGEETLFELWRALERGPRAAREVAGLAFKDDDGRVARTPARPPPDLEGLPFVYQGKALGMLRRYLARRSVREATGYEASRGCPFLCTFCYSPGFHSDARVKSPAKVAGELARLKALGVTDLDVYDDTLFGARRGAFDAYLDAFDGAGLRWIGNLRINMLDERLLARLERSGCKWLYFGVESCDDETLAAMKKGLLSEEIRAGARLMSRSPIQAVYSVIWGLPIPGEKDKVWRYLDFAAELHSLHPRAEVQVQSYVPLPGTELYPKAVALGFRPPATLEGWAGHDHFGSENPWLDDPSLAPKLYIASFLAYRYRRHLSWFPASLLAYPLHRLSLWRLRTRRFGVYFERGLYAAVEAASGAAGALAAGVRRLAGA